jgi:hypothetical protein
VPPLLLSVRAGRCLEGATPVSDVSSLVVDTSRDEEFARKLFGDLNCDIFGPPDDGKIIIIDDSDDDNEE